MASPQFELADFEFPDWCIVSHQAGESEKKMKEDENPFHTTRSSETNQRPAADYMQNLQKYITPESRAHCVDFLVHAADTLHYSQSMLHLTVNCLDCYLSQNSIDCDELEFVGLTCMMANAKYVDVDAYVNLTSNTCSRRDFKVMETALLVSLGSNGPTIVPTAWTFLEMLLLFLGDQSNNKGVLEHMASFIADVSLVTYRALRFAPSVVAASAVFLARFLLEPSKKPWNSELQKYTDYEAIDLRDCVLELFSSCHFEEMFNIRMKYAAVALQIFPQSIPSDVFYSKF